MVPISEYVILNIKNVENEENDFNGKRLDELFSKIDFKNLNIEATDLLKEVINEYSDLFYLEGDNLTSTETISQN